MTSPHNLLALLDELEKKAEQYEAPDYFMMLPVHADMLKAFPLLSQKLREAIAVLELLDRNGISDSIAKEALKSILSLPQ